MGALLERGRPPLLGCLLCLFVIAPLVVVPRRCRIGRVVVRFVGASLALGGPEIHDVTINVWIDNGTDLPLRTRLRFALSSGDGSATARMETRFRDYGEPVAIEVPDVAREDHLEHGCPGE